MTKGYTTETIMKGIGTLLAVLIIAAILFPVSTGAPYHPARCLSNLKQIGLALFIYENDYDQRLPKADDWMDSTKEYLKDQNVLHDSDGVQAGEYGYAFRDKASGLNSDSVKDKATFPLVFDSTLTQRNAHSEPGSMPNPGRHQGVDNVGFLDGHVKGTKIGK